MSMNFVDDSDDDNDEGCGYEDAEQEAWREPEYVTEQFSGTERTHKLVDKYEGSSSSKRRKSAMKKVTDTMQFPEDHPVAIRGLGFMDAVYELGKTQGQKLILVAAACFFIACRLSSSPITIRMEDIAHALVNAGFSLWYLKPKKFKVESSGERANPAKRIRSSGGVAATSSQSRVASDDAVKAQCSTARCAQSMSSGEATPSVSTSTKSDSDSPDPDTGTRRQPFTTEMGSTSSVNSANTDSGNQTVACNEMTRLYRMKTTIVQDLLACGRLHPSEARAVTEQPWERKLEKAVSSIRVKRGQQGDIDGGPGMQLMKDLAKEILQYVHLDDFGDGINPHIVIAAAMIEARRRMLPSSPMSEKEIFEHFRDLGTERAILKRRVLLTKKLDVWLRRQLSSQQVGVIPAEPKAFLRLLEEANYMGEQRRQQLHTKSLEIRQEIFVRRQSEAQPMRKPASTLKTLKNIDPGRLTERQSSIESTDSIGEDPFSPQTLDSLFVDGVKLANDGFMRLSKGDNVNEGVDVNGESVGVADTTHFSPSAGVKTGDCRAKPQPATTAVNTIDPPTIVGKSPCNQSHAKAHSIPEHAGKNTAASNAVDSVKSCTASIEPGRSLEASLKSVPCPNFAPKKLTQIDRAPSAATEASERARPATALDLAVQRAGGLSSVDDGTDAAW